MDLLQSLNISRNHLEGEIFKILAKLKHINSSDLSRYNSKGTILEGFANLSKLITNEKITRLTRKKRENINNLLGIMQNVCQ